MNVSYKGMKSMKLKDQVHISRKTGGQSPNKCPKVHEDVKSQTAHK